jgi:hypothetical protein
MADHDVYLPHVLALHRKRRCLQYYTGVLMVLLLECLLLVLQSLYTRLLLHTSILTGEAWILELLVGHPDRIYYSLGVRKHVFYELIANMRAMGLTDSRHVTLEEQLAIFLHTSLTGLTIRHLGE